MMADAVLKKIANRLARRRSPKDKLCVICDQPVEGFAPYRGGWNAAPPLMRTLKMIGSDMDHWSCPCCGSHDRERHLLLFMQRLRLLDRFHGASVLHFAPEKRLSKILMARKPANYVLADLFPTEIHIQRLDLLEIDYPSGTLDIVLANHVLEHVSDDRRGLHEIHRVLKPGGFAILQTPFSARLHATFEDGGIDDDDARLAIYGQEDHVRLFGRDIFQRFESSGLVADIRQHSAVLADIDPIKYGVNTDEPLFLFHRK